MYKLPNYQGSSGIVSGVCNERKIKSTYRGSISSL